MRILITGSSSGTQLGIHLIKKTNLSWRVVSSFEKSCVDWKNCPKVNMVSQAAQVSENDIVDSEQPLVIEVIALSFFERPWVKEYLSVAKNVIVIVSSPIHFMDKKLLTTFDRLLIVKTLSPEKQSQYYTLFVDTKSMNTIDFKKTVKALDDKQYVEVKDGLVSVIQWVESEDMLKKGVVEEKIPMQGLKSSKKVLNPSPKENPKVQPEKESLEVSSSDYCFSMIKSKEPSVDKTSGNKAVEEKEMSFPSRPLVHKSIAGSVPAEHISELWVTFTPQGGADAKVTSIEIDECVASFEEMVSNDLIISMIATTCKKRNNDAVEFYFHVYKQRQDLFVTLMMNILQSLRANQLITTGSIMI